jgi:hypothetical protein
MYYFRSKNAKKRDRFLCSDTDKKVVEAKVKRYISKGYEQVGRTAEDVDPFNGSTRYVAVLRKKKGENA